MDRLSFLSLYQTDSIFQTLSHRLGKSSRNTFHIKGLSGSLDMVLLASYFQKLGGVHLILAQDKEEASFLNSDLQQLLGSEEYRIFPG
ncbi:MAG: hypothetical protein FJZ76_08315, partial [Bacteroidetes bacterium]|nr:hypothetical protein [Bacteroidota bacterium]